MQAGVSERGVWGLHCTPKFKICTPRGYTPLYPSPHTFCFTTHLVLLTHGVSRISAVCYVPDPVYFNKWYRQKTFLSFSFFFCPRPFSRQNFLNPAPYINIYLYIYTCMYIKTVCVPPTFKIVLTRLYVCIYVRKYNNYVCMQIHTNTNTHTHIYTYTLTGHTRAHTHANSHTNTYAHDHAHTSALTHTHSQTHTHTYMHTRVRTHTHTCPLTQARMHICSKFF